jgi:FdrA protein
MTSIKHELRRGAYYDSVILMQLQRALLELQGVEDAGVVMATAANMELLEDSGLLVPGLEPRPEDLLIVVRATSEALASEAIAQVDSILKHRRSSAASEYRPRSLESAVKSLPEAAWVLISVPGRYAAAVADEALALGKHVFLYSDNVTIEDEVKLKTTARDLGLLLMGPDCGTAIIDGIGFGFANRVRSGAIGLVGASGTGLQAISSAIHHLGQGVSHALGTGGRDLKREVGAITAHQGLDLLAKDADTQVIVLVSKPPDMEVASGLLAAARRTGKPTVINFIGYAPPVGRFDNLIFTTTLHEAAQAAVKCVAAGLDSQARREHSDQSRPGYLRGLFSGGTLAIEAVRGLQALVGPIHTNLDVPGAIRLDDPLVSIGHTVLDLGEDVFTVGRLHPMIDNDLRIRRMRQEANDEGVSLLLLDVVLGEGAHPDPASELGPAIEDIRRRSEIQVGVLLVGTEEDPQDIDRQREILEAAGAHVTGDTISLVAFAVDLLSQGEAPQSPPVSPTALASPIAGINIGLESFYESLNSQGARAVHVDWRPPAGGDDRLMDILNKMKASRRDTEFGTRREKGEAG